MSRRILLMYISDVSGHKQATLAVEEGIRSIDHGAEILNINAFNYTNPISEKIINKLYIGVIKRTPKIWEYLYDNPSVVKNTNVLKQMIHRFNAPKLKSLFDRFQPDAIACSQAFPCGMAAYFKECYGIDIPLVGILTDYTSHSYWIYDNVNYYVVPSESVKEQLIRRGVGQEKIKVLGIPIEPKFAQAQDREQIRNKLGLEAHIPVVLIMGGGQGLGPMKKIVSMLNKLKTPLQMIVVCGTNKKLYTELNEKKDKIRKKIIIFPFVNNIEQLMESSDLIITKPGGITTAEALAKGLPMIIIKPIPGQEESNTQYLLERGVAIKVDEIKNLPKCILELLSDSARLNEMSQKARSISRPNSSRDIANLLLGLCEKIRCD